jgi:hypothetical protein
VPRHATRVRRGRAAAGRCRAVPRRARCNSSISFLALHVALSRTPPLPCLAALRRRALLSFSLPRSPPRTASEPPLIHAGDRATTALIDAFSIATDVAPHGETLPIHRHFPFWSRPHLPRPPL